MANFHQILLYTYIGVGYLELQQNYEITVFDAAKNVKINDIGLKSQMLMCTKIFLVKGSHTSCAPTLN